MLTLKLELADTALGKTSAVQRVLTQPSLMQYRAAAYISFVLISQRPTNRDFLLYRLEQKYS